MTRILVLCTGNSCRSQMAEGFLRSWDGTLEVFSAGTAPAAGVHPLAVAVMREAGFDDGAIVKEKPGVLPDDVIAQYLHGEELDAFRRMPTPILSITVTGTRSRCCSPENACA